MLRWWDGNREPDGTVLDGEVLAYEDGQPLPFARLQRRIGRQKLTPKVLAEAPAAFIAFDLLEDRGEDLRNLPLRERRARLEAMLKDTPRFPLSPEVTVPTWEELARARDESRARNVEGFMLKRLDSTYQHGRKRGAWWKWKAYSGLTDEEIAKLDRWIRTHTREKFGPVRAVEPEHVFELHFEGIAPSPRHKSGIALRFPRIARWRLDKTPRDADSLDSLKQLLQAQPR